MTARSISARVTEAAAVRAELVTEMESLLTRAESEDRVLSATEQAKFDKLKAAIAQGDTHLENLRVCENVVARSAVRVVPAREKDAPPLEKGIGIARLAQLLIASRGNDLQAVELCKRHFPDMPQMEQVFREPARSMSCSARRCLRRPRRTRRGPARSCMRSSSAPS